MAKSAPGKHYRKGLTLTALFDKFPDDKTAEAWFAAQRWGGDITCPHCGCDNVQTGAAHKTMPYRCRAADCRKRFSTKTGTVLEASNIGYRLWAIAICLVLTNLKGISSMKLHRDLGVTQSTAWFMLHRIREAWADPAAAPFAGPVEVDETFVGGKAKNMHAVDRERRITGRGGADKAVVVGIKDRRSGEVVAEVVADTEAATLRPFVEDHTRPTAMVFTDGHKGYNAVKRPRAEVHHSAGEYVRGIVRTNGIESLWSMFKRGYVGTYHHMSDAHLGRYVSEFAGRHNLRELGTPQQMATVVGDMVGKRLRYDDLVAAGPVGTVAEPDRSEPW